MKSLHLFAVLSPSASRRENGSVYDDDFMVSNGTDSSKSYYRIGEHDFARVLKDCGKPDWYEEE